MGVLKTILEARKEQSVGVLILTHARLRMNSLGKAFILMRFAFVFHLCMHSFLRLVPFQPIQVTRASVVRRMLGSRVVPIGSQRVL